MLKSFNVFGRVTVERDQVVITNTYFTKENKGWPTTMIVEESTPEIPVGQTGEFLYGMMVKDSGSETELFHHVVQPIEGVELTDLPAVKKYLSQVAGSIQFIISKVPAV